MPQARKPIIPTEAISEFGDLRQHAAFADPNAMDQDYTYVPGYSEQRRAAELAVAEARRGERDTNDIPTLPVKLIWVRNQKVSGLPDTTVTYRQQGAGFQMVHKDQVGKEPWITSMPPGAQPQADGSIRQGDSVLMYCDAETAMKQEIRHRNETELRTTGAENAFTARLKEAGKKIFGGHGDGLDPEIKQLKKNEPSFSKK